MLAGMKYRVAELTGEHRYRGLGFIPRDAVREASVPPLPKQMTRLPNCAPIS